MELVSLSDAPPPSEARFVAVPFLDGVKCNARVIRLSPGQSLPPHKHEPSELMLFVAEGDAELLGGNEELRVSNRGSAAVTLLAFLAPPFPPR